MIHRYGRQWFPPANPDVNVAADISLRQLKRISTSGCLRELHNYLAARPRLGTKIKSIVKRCVIAQYQGAPESVLAIGFVDWYPGFKEESNFITELLDRAGIKWITKEPVKSDIVFSGCYGTQLSRGLSLSAFIVFVSGENLRPDYSIHDFSITTDAYSYNARNVRLPEWHHLLDYNSSWQAVGIKNHEQIRKAVRPWEDREYMVSAVYNNATPAREEIVSFLQKTLGKNNVHIFGSQRGKVVDKNKVLGNSKMNICFENSLYPGYVTEKLPQCLLMGCHALYWGDKSWSSDFHASSIFNYSEKRSLEELGQWVKETLSRDRAPFRPTTVEGLCKTHAPIEEACSMLLLLSNAVRRTKELFLT